MIPLWLKIARNFIGLKEAPGPANNPVIMGWAANLGIRILGIVYTADSVPWCGLYMAHVMRAAGLMPPKIAVRAAAWATWGVACTPCPGAVLVRKRPGGHHVCLYERETTTHYCVVGGNQSDAVTETWMPKSEFIASRWPDPLIPLGAPVVVATRGASAGSMA